MQKIIFLALALVAMAARGDDEAIKANLTKIGAKNIEISDSPIAGLKTIVSDQGIVYSDPEGKYFLQGGFFEIGADGTPKDLSVKPLMAKLEKLKDQMITYPAEEEKHVVTVFFDTTCHYCQLLHKDVPELNKKGITVRYLAFPRQGLNSKNARQMETIFAAEDKKKAMGEAEEGKELAETAVDKVRDQYNLGVQMGVTGTPAIFNSDGELIGGYLKPEQMLATLEKK